MIANLFSIHTPSKINNQVLKSNFRDTTPFTKRKAESTRIRLKYPDRVPVVCEVVPTSKSQIQLDRHKYLVPGDLTVGQFLIVVRKKIKLGAEQAIYIFNDYGGMPMCSSLMSVIYQQQKNIDGFIYFGIAVENTFG